MSCRTYFARAVALGLVVFAPAITTTLAFGAAAQERECTRFARNAIREARQNQERRCGFSGRAWSTNYNVQFRWCMSASNAARRRARLERQRGLRRCPGARRRNDTDRDRNRGRDRDRGRNDRGRDDRGRDDRGRDDRNRRRFCTREYRPVCAVRRGNRRTYPNACEARQADARIIDRGRCRDDRRGDRRNDWRGDRRGSACRLGNVRLIVSSPGCSPRTMRVRFNRRVLRNGQSVVREVNSGTIGRGYQPWGVCNFHTRIQYRCRNGRLRIGRVLRCQQARTNATSATCSVRD